MVDEPSNPTLYIIAGRNGAGKTTFARNFLVQRADCTQFVNADLIAQGLSPFAPETAALRAGRLMLEQLDTLAEKRVTFAFETTLSGRGYVAWLRSIKTNGYSVRLDFLWLPSVDIALARVAGRVRRGGHAVPDADVRRRYTRGLNNFFELYQGLADAWSLIDSSGPAPDIIAFMDKGRFEIADPERFARVNEMRRGHA